MSEVSWAQAMQALLRAESPDEWAHILTGQRQELLTPVNLLSLERAIRDAEHQRVPIAAQMQVVYNFLKMAYEKGIPAAVAYENSRRETITHANATFLSAAVWDAPEVLSRMQSTLLDPDALRMIKRVAAISSAQANPADPMTPIRLKIIHLKLALLEDARTGGIDAATSRYTTEMALLMQQAQKGNGGSAD